MSRLTVIKFYFLFSMMSCGMVVNDDVDGGASDSGVGTKNDSGGRERDGQTEPPYFCSTNSNKIECLQDDFDDSSIGNGLWSSVVINSDSPPIFPVVYEDGAIKIEASQFNNDGLNENAGFVTTGNWDATESSLEIRAKLTNDDLPTQIYGLGIEVSFRSNSDTSHFVALTFRRDKATTYVTDRVPATIDSVDGGGIDHSIFKDWNVSFSDNELTWGIGDHFIETIVLPDNYDFSSCKVSLKASGKAVDDDPRVIWFDDLNIMNDPI